MYNVGECSCINHISEKGFGNCKALFKNEPICYVKIPTSCADAASSKTERNKKYSWEACKGEYYIWFCGNIFKRCNKIVNLKLSC